MELLMELFPNAVHYIELLPVGCVALLAGVINYFNTEVKESNTKLYALKTITTSAFLGLIAYSMLSATDLPYLAKIGITAGIAFFGIDKAIELVQRIISLRNGGGQSDKEKTAEIKESIEKVKQTRKPRAKKTKEANDEQE